MIGLLIRRLAGHVPLKLVLHALSDRGRRRAGLELSIVVLVTAEIIAKVYYAALRDATASPILRRLCEQILRDEEAHVRFQCIDFDGRRFASVPGTSAESPV